MSGDAGLQSVPNEIQEWLSGIAVHHMPEKFIHVSPKKAGRSRAKSGSGKSGGSKMWIVWLVVGVLVAGMVGVALYIFISSQGEGEVVDTEPAPAVTETPETPIADIPRIGRLTSGDEPVETPEPVEPVELETDNGITVPPAEVVPVTPTPPVVTEPVEPEPVVPSGPLPSSEDSDSDGLTDAEEELIGTNVFLVDSDNDGFADTAELLNGFDPTQGGGAVLRDASFVREHVNRSQNYSVLFPATWSVASLDQTERDVLFSSPSGDSFELRVQENVFGVTDARSWYLSQFPTAGARDFSQLTVSGFSGVRTSDGLTMYLVDASNVYVLVYDPGVGAREADFYSLFGMFANSFQVFSNLL